MATIKFSLKGKKSENSIYVRFIDGRQMDVTVSTGYIIQSEHWSTTKNWILPKSKFIGKEELEKELLDLKNFILEKRSKEKNSGVTLNREWLIRTIKEFKGVVDFDEVNSITHLFKEYVKKLPSSVRNSKLGVSPGTLRNYNTTRSRIEKYEEFLGKKLQLLDINFEFHTKYIEFADKNLELSINSIGKDIKQLKTIITDARDNGLKINEQSLSRKFNAPSEKTIFTTLDKKEIEGLMKFNGSESLNNTRDWLVIGCWSGCRVSDLMNLRMENIHQIKNNKVIRYTQRKTGKIVTVPIHPHVEQIINRLNNFPRPISYEKFNEYIKMLCKNIGMTQDVFGTRQNPKTHKKETGMFPKFELIRSHICRRSFATNHYNELPNKIIMAVTGHSTEKMLLNYIGVTEENHIDDFLELWNIK